MVETNWEKNNREKVLFTLLHNHFSLPGLAPDEPLLILKPPSAALALILLVITSTPMNGNLNE